MRGSRRESGRWKRKNRWNGALGGVMRRADGIYEGIGGLARQGKGCSCGANHAEAAHEEEEQFFLYSHYEEESSVLSISVKWDMCQEFPLPSNYAKRVIAAVQNFLLSCQAQFDQSPSTIIPMRQYLTNLAYDSLTFSGIFIRFNAVMRTELYYKYLSKLTNVTCAKSWTSPKSITVFRLEQLLL